ncbi:hypothetical protein PRZ48_014944 [Zasmidium cellare]|uniref:F-box domain-containing protein n=1 Tax=Zasmidium cellare TaxID=395010 RepID=A0ABR0DX73_ZASCE|nr:hypothetical protein PRZ48_014944 [Zasmidium cellare]
MATAAPRQAVFGTAEILEEILSYLPAATLWTCQGVCKQFQAITRSSPVLQQETMLKSRATARLCWRLESRRWVMDPFGQSRFVIHDGEVSPNGPPEHGMFGRPAIVNTSFWTPARLCPLLAVNNGWNEAARRDSAFRLQNQGGEHVRFNCSENIMSTLESCGKLLVTDPPCFEANVTLRFVVGHYGIPDGTMHLERKVKNPDGLRFSDLIVGALQMPGWVSWEMEGRQYNREYQQPDRVLKRMEERLGVAAILDVGGKQGWSYTRILLTRMVIPADEEWSTVKLARSNKVE